MSILFHQSCLNISNNFESKTKRFIPYCPLTKFSNIISKFCTFRKTWLNFIKRLFGSICVVFSNIFIKLWWKTKRSDPYCPFKKLLIIFYEKFICINLVQLVLSFRRNSSTHITRPFRSRQYGSTRIVCYFRGILIKRQYGSTHIVIAENFDQKQDCSTHIAFSRNSDEKTWQFDLDPYCLIRLFWSFLQKTIFDLSCTFFLQYFWQFSLKRQYSLASKWILNIFKIEI